MKLTSRARQFGSRTLAALTPSETAWRGAGTAILVFTTFVCVVYFATYFIQDFTWQKLPAYFTTVTSLFLAGAVALVVVAIAMRVPAVYRVPLFVFAPFAAMALAMGDDTEQVLFSVVLVLIVSLIGAGIGVLRKDGFHPATQRVTLSVLAIGVLGLIGGLYAIFSDKESANPLLDDFELEDRTLDLPNPGLPGAFDVLTLTYGSGEDLRRPEYGADVDVVARSVDASKLIENWDGMAGWLRTSYWGFDVAALPLQARVWMPDDEGPFPLVLIVHGNHSMEDFSDPGYGYLGELLASRGIILASVDENFINGTFSARVDVLSDTPGLQEENDARGWLLLEHLRQWRDWSEQPGHPLHGKADMDRVALIGHTRGGEADGIAAAFNSLDRYPDDATVDFDFGFNLRGVIAIAPVYGQYEPRERPTPVRDVNYFTIHGDMDGDVQSFEGIAQYSRVSFPGDDFRFRSGLYVVGANHGQFNTTWENLDTSIFRAWALDLDGIMAPEAQRDVARVYFSAFLEIVLNNRDDYLPIFKDARYAADWLPETFYINTYADSGDVGIVTFEEDIDPTTTTWPGGRIEGHDVSRWYESANSLKYDDLDTHSLVVAWDEDYSDAVAQMYFHLPELDLDTGSVISMSISAADIGTLPDDWEDDGESEVDTPAGDDSGDDADAAALDWTIELTDANGTTVSLPLSHDSPLYPQVQAVPRRAGFIESDEPAEVLFRRFEFAVEHFAAANPEFDPAMVTRIGFVFDRSQKGAILVDDISVSRNR